MTSCSSTEKSQEPRDPVCGMFVNPETSAHSFSYMDQTYWFCCSGCRTKFEKNPDQYLQQRDEVPESASNVSLGKTAAGTDYTCPMHPEIVESGPADCPICGMALEPMVPSLDRDQENPELIDFTRRFKLGLLFGIPILILSMGPHIGLLSSRLIPDSTSHWLQLILSTPIVLWCGLPFFQRGWASVRNRSLNMFSLIALGSGTAYLVSISVVLFPEFFRPVFSTIDGQFGVYFEVSAAIILLVLLGQVLELKGRERTKIAIQSLLELTPQTAMRLKENGELEEIDIEQIFRGDLLQVRPGEHVPADGTVHQGTSSVDESLLSGESIPVEKLVGDPVHAGTMNGTGSFVMRVKHAQSDTILSQMIHMVARAQMSQAPIQRLADFVASWFVPVVMLVAVVSFVLWLNYGPEPAPNFALVVFVSILIIACPCALGLATPMSVTVSVGRAVREGILVKDAAALEVLSKVKTLVVDKTGTLTVGKPKLIHIGTERSDSDQILSYAAAVCRASEHPLSQAIVNAAQDKGVPTLVTDKFEALPGLGITGQVDSKRIALGNARFMTHTGVGNFESFTSSIQQKNPESSLVYLSVENELQGMFEIADTIKETTPDAIRSLQNRGITVIMVTGDHADTANAIAAKCGIEEVYAGALPEDKVNIVRKIQKDHPVAMAGDGVNDAPALIQAEVGFAMGSGSDVSLECADLTIPNSDLQNIVRARVIAEATMKNIRQNLWFAFAYNLAGVPIAAGVLYPFFGILLSPVFAAAAMSLSSVSVIGNSLRLQKMKIEIN